MSLLHAEFLKVSRRMLYPIMIAILASLMAIIALLFFVLLPAIPDALGDSYPIPQRPVAFIFGAQQVAGQAWWFALILVTAVLGAEVSTTVWATGLTRDPRKGAHVTSRFVVFTVASWIAFLMATALWAIITFIAAEGSGSLELAEWLGLVWKFLLIAAAWTSIGLGAVAMTRSIGISMGVALGLSFVDGIVAPFVEAYEQISLSAATNGIFAINTDGPFSVFIPGGEMSIFHAVGVMVGWSLVGLALSWWGFQWRDA